MSGGFAYVLDETGDFAKVRCNRSSVDLDPVNDPADIEIRYGTGSLGMRREGLAAPAG